MEEVVISGRPPSMFLTLWEPPKIFNIPQDNTDMAALAALMGEMGWKPIPNTSQTMKRERLSRIPHDDADHGAVVGQSLIYSITISPEDFASKTERLRENEYLNFTSHNVPVDLFSCKYMAEGLASFKSAIAECSQTIPFDILYQFQALVQNGYLLPHITQALLLRFKKSKSCHTPPTSHHVRKTESDSPLGQFPFSSQAVKSEYCIFFRY